MDMTNKTNAAAEIVHCIEKAGLTPDKCDLTQLHQAIDIISVGNTGPQGPSGPQGEKGDKGDKGDIGEKGEVDLENLKTLIDQAIRENRPSIRYDICEFYYFRNPNLKPGFITANGILIADAATLYPEAWAFLQTDEGKSFCITEDEWQSMSKATWATLADGKKIGWDGVGGVPFYAVNRATGALRLPDLRGMYAEVAGFDSLGVGGVHGDAIRDITGTLDAFSIDNNGVLRFKSNNGSFLNGNNNHVLYDYKASFVVPTAAKNQPRAYGVLGCVYLGNPS